MFHGKGQHAATLGDVLALVENQQQAQPEAQDCVVLSVVSIICD
jgi:hypothetical protein